MNSNLKNFLIILRETKKRINQQQNKPNNSYLNEKTKQKNLEIFELSIRENE